MDVELLPIEIAEALERGATVVTGNQRAARTLRHAFDRRNRTLELSSWRPAVVLAWDAWVAGLWRGLLIEGHVSQLLLNRTQEHAVWRAILDADSERHSLKSVDSLAEMAADAWKRLCSYNGQERLRGAAVSADTRAFQRWAAVFQRRCISEGFLAQAQLEEALRLAVEAGRVSPGGEIALVGFDAMTPAQSGLVEAIRVAGVIVRDVRLDVSTDARILVEAADEHQELFVAARWVRELLERQPGSRVAVIVPGLEKQRAEIDRVFREVLAPELQSIEAGNESSPYEFSVGVMLAGTPMVAAALDVLRWATEALPLERVSELLLSTYFAMGDSEFGVRAAFDAYEMRKARMLRPEVSVDWLIAALDHSKRKAKLGRFMGALRSMRVIVANRIEGGDRRTYAEWAGRMRELLEAAGWGAGAGENSVEFQTRKKWESALDELTTLDFDGVRVGFQRALEGVERIARETMFAPESREAPVQVMGPLEAAGSTFDAVWFLRGGDLTWPVAVGANPLLSWQMQGQLGMPGADTAGDGERVQAVTTRIAGSAGTVIFSYAKESSEGRQKHSPVLAGLLLEKVSAAEVATDEIVRSIVELEVLEDSTRVRELPDQVIRGGARILELQAACGFRAFAEQRLWSTELEDSTLGMDARESGTVVHRVLQIFWDEVRTQSALKAMTPIERAALLDQCIMEGLRRTAELSATSWDAAYVDVQRERLRKLLGPWLEMELTRAPFEVKLSEKEFRDERVGPLRLSVRMDRVDLVEGGEVLIDYKTGDAAPADWLTGRPAAPQLPLYAVLSKERTLQGVAFGLVRAGKDMAFKGYEAKKGILPKATKMRASSLESQVDEWEHVLIELATQFHAGDVRVDPNKYPATCEHCGQRILCRLDTASLERDEVEENGSAEEDSRG
jgi:ATP-dependent helicase/nuclease subunit B